MKFGFNHVTDEARQMLDELGVKYTRDSDSTWSLYTDTYDIWRDEQAERGLDAVDHKRERSQVAVRVFLDQEKRIYYYLIKNVVFFMYNKISKDYSTYPPTEYVISILDLLEKSEQESKRDYLLTRASLFERPI